MGIGNEKYLTQALFDTVSNHTTIHVDELATELSNCGFSQESIQHIIAKYDINKVVGTADLSKIEYAEEIGLAPIVVTYPAYDNCGLPSSFQFQKSIGKLLDNIQYIIGQATERIIILSPFIEVNGLKYIGEKLIRKLKRGVKISIITRELNDNHAESKNRIDGIIEWIRKNIGKDPNFTLYDYHYNIDEKIESTCHGKVVVADKRYAYIGSGDVRERAFCTNYEVGSLHTGYSARVISEMMEKIIEVSKKFEV